MTQLRKAKIAGTGMYVPPKVVTNKDLEAVMDTSDEWIKQRSGIEQRHHVEGIGTSDLAFEAAKNAMTAANVSAEDIDLILLATLSPDHQFPGSSAVLQAKLGLSTTPSMDIKCQCSGFIYGLNVGKLFVESGQYNRVLVVGAEAHSPVLDFSTEGRDVTVLFGDGAGAAIIEASDDDSQIMHCSLHSQGEFANRLWIERPGTAGGEWLTEAHKAERQHFPYMEGRYVFKHAVTRLSEVIHETLEKNDLTLADIDHFLFHQANLRINEKVAAMLEIPEEKCHNNIMRYGNCSAASIPMLLDECVRQEKVKKGDIILMAAFGAGFTWAGSVIKW
ncbi:3-oxoacyl-ACP synthase III family protein [Pseudobacteriovorax antillogorgiicola]|uniref:Beta-ketoacyl-[acyl-carrier-protein] synthase III n=1 Tax=Pseudobacteriovorax antillogorgiicola TaxID=1513793 RepID=A0A1Y6B7I6_9BACT|nr:beta-ketoacyl-ACP synthase III [Pseudobacteriovorax antillogorgiicola]TCS59428.1 3-oxoacyl-[acyl-carrier-protein] synthase III [Pseudobacteriovorax antillogorgiicola]SME88362.1 3-oxoacyl-[acyl-carrier-protein] synthase-3 [Pseudobacteriovorax antillogorgiicola]